MLYSFKGKNVKDIETASETCILKNTAIYAANFKSSKNIIKTVTQIQEDNEPIVSMDDKKNRCI